VLVYLIRNIGASIQIKCLINRIWFHGHRLLEKELLRFFLLISMGLEMWRCILNWTVCICVAVEIATLRFPFLVLLLQQLLL